MDERMINLLVFVATMLAASALSYRLAFIRGVRKRARPRSARPSPPRRAQNE